MKTSTDASNSFAATGGVPSRALTGAKGGGVGRRSAALVLLLAAYGVLADPAPGFRQQEEATTLRQAALPQHAATVAEWRARRDASLRREDSWLTLVGLEWLKPGPNSLGSGADNEVVLGAGPERWGVIDLAGDTLVFRRAPGSDVAVDGAWPDEVLLVADPAGEPTVIQSGSVRVQVIFRESYAVRIQDSEAPNRLAFDGVENYPVQPEWLVEGTITRPMTPTTVEIANVLGQVTATPVHGYFEFERDGRIHRLLALDAEDSQSLWLIFADRTNGHGTYGAGRFLYSEGLPTAGRLLLDFNKAYNPPCAFTEFSTCPLPPPENRLDLAVTAGELEFRSVSTR